MMFQKRHCLEVVHKCLRFKRDHCNTTTTKLKPQSQTHNIVRNVVQVLSNEIVLKNMFQVLSKGSLFKYSGRFRRG